VFYLSLNPSSNIFTASVKRNGFGLTVSGSMQIGIFNTDFEVEGTLTLDANDVIVPQLSIVFYSK